MKNTAKRLFTTGFPEGELLRHRQLVLCFSPFFFTSQLGSVCQSINTDFGVSGLERHRWLYKFVNMLLEVYVLRVSALPVEINKR